MYVLDRYYKLWSPYYLDLRTYPYRRLFLHICSRINYKATHNINSYKLKKAILSNIPKGYKVPLMSSYILLTSTYSFEPSMSLRYLRFP